MKLNKLAELGIASIVLFGSVGLSAVNAQPAQALEVRQATTGKAELLNVNFRHHGRRSFKRHGRRNFRHHGRRSFKRNFKRHAKHNLRHHRRRNHRHHLNFDKAFSTGNNYDERIIRVRLF